MADWFKFYPHWLSDTDFLYAIDRLPETLTVWVSLLCEACDHKSGTLDAQDANRRLMGYARKTNISIPKINEALNLLSEIGKIDRSNPDKIRIPCWNHTQSTYCKRVGVVTKVLHRTHNVRTRAAQTDHIVSSEESRVEEKRVEENGKTYPPEARVALLYLNEKSGRGFRETAKNLDFITARLREPGVTIEGVRRMIDRQCQKWLKTNMADYLRPETLFNATKFDGYYAARELGLDSAPAQASPTVGHPFHGLDDREEWRKIFFKMHPELPANSYKFVEYYQAYEDLRDGR